MGIGHDLAGYLRVCHVSIVLHLRQNLRLGLFLKSSMFQRSDPRILSAHKLLWLVLVSGICKIWLRRVSPPHYITLLPRPIFREVHETLQMRTHYSLGGLSKTWGRVLYHRKAVSGLLGVHRHSCYNQSLLGFSLLSSILYTLQSALLQCWTLLDSAWHGIAVTGNIKLQPWRRISLWQHETWRAQ